MLDCQIHFIGICTVYFALRRCQNLGTQSNFYKKLGQWLCIYLIYCYALSVPTSPNSFEPTNFSTPVHHKRLRIEEDDSDEELMLVYTYNRYTLVQKCIVFDVVIIKVMIQLMMLMWNGE